MLVGIIQSQAPGGGHDARLMPAKSWPYSKGQKNDFRDAEAIAEAVQRPWVVLIKPKSRERHRPHIPQSVSLLRVRWVMRRER